MPSETQTLLLGAGISLLTSIITIIVTSLIQLARDNRTRNWKIEDDNHILELETVKGRIKELENFIDILSEFGRRILLFETSIINQSSHEDKKDSDKKISMQTLIKEYTQDPKNFSRSILEERGIYYNDDDIENIKNFVDKRADFLKKLPVNFDELSPRLAEFHEKFTRIKILNDYDNKDKYDFHNATAKYIIRLMKEIEIASKLKVSYTNFNQIDFDEEYKRISDFMTDTSDLNADIRYHLDRLQINFLKR